MRAAKGALALALLSGAGYLLFSSAQALTQPPGSLDARGFESWALLSVVMVAGLLVAAALEYRASKREAGGT